MKNEYFPIMEMERAAVIKLSNVDMTDDLKQALLGFHAFTGDYYVSSFLTNGKADSWKWLKVKGS